MYKGYRILAVIPARGGSRGLPEKNIRQFIDRPLLYWTIGAANNSNYIDLVAVSTEDSIIKSLCEQIDTIVVDRPEILSRDESPSCEAIIHAIDYFKNVHALQYDVIIQLECTSPLRKPNDIDNAIEDFIDNYGTTDSLVSVGELTSDTEHPYCVKVEEDGYLIPFIKDSPPIYQRQQLNNAYSVFGGIYMSKVYKYRQYLTFYQERTIGYKVERWQKFEIDDEIDFICCEAIAKEKL